MWADWLFLITPEQARVWAPPVNGNRTTNPEGAGKPGDEPRGESPGVGNKSRRAEAEIPRGERFLEPRRIGRNSWLASGGRPVQ